MLKIEELRESIHDMRKRALGLQKRPTAASAGAQAITSALDDALEELEVAEAEIRARADEVAGSVAVVEAERRRHAELLDFLPDGYLVTDRDGVIGEANREAGRLLGVSPGGLAGKPLAVYAVGDSRSALLRLLRKVEGDQWDGRATAELWLQPRGRAPFPARVDVAGAPAGSPFRRWLVRDVTERFRLERRIRHQREMTRLGETAALLADLVRRPLAGLGSALELVARPERGAFAADIVAAAREQVDRLATIVDRLAALAGRARLERAPVKALALLRETAMAVAGELGNEHLRIEVAGHDPLVAVDADWLADAVRELVRNAACVSGLGEAIAVRLDVRDGRLVMEVRDRGPGIPPELRERALEPFFSTWGGSLGLGLPLARRIAAAHGGHLRLRFPPEGGTVAALELPLTPTDVLPGASPV